MTSLAVGIGEPNLHPFDENPAPWRAYTDAEWDEWVVEDANGNEVFTAPTIGVGKSTIDGIVRAVNAYKTSEHRSEPTT